MTTSLTLSGDSIALYLNQGVPSGLTTDGTETMTNKAIDLADNTVTGTKAEFDTACSDGDFVFQGGALGTPASGALTHCTADGVNAVGPRNIPQIVQSADYTCVLADAGSHLLHPSADTVARTFTIPANSSVAYPVGTAITFINQYGAGVLTIAITTDTMRLAGDGVTGSRMLSANGIATAVKVAPTEWLLSGVGLS